MSWEHAHYDTAFAVFLTAGDDDMPQPDAVFFDEEEADEYIARAREKAWLDDFADDRVKAEASDRKPEDYLQEASCEEVRNLYVPWWNSTDPIVGNPAPIPEHAGTIVSPDREFLTAFFYRLSMVFACLRHYARRSAPVDLECATKLAAEAAKELKEFREFFRELVG